MRINKEKLSQQIDIVKAQADVIFAKSKPDLSDGVQARALVAEQNALTRILWCLEE